MLKVKQANKTKTCQSRTLHQAKYSHIAEEEIMTFSTWLHKNNEMAYAYMRQRRFPERNIRDDETHSIVRAEYLQIYKVCS